MIVTPKAEAVKRCLDSRVVKSYISGSKAILFSVRAESMNYNP